MLYFRGCVAKEKLTHISDVVEMILQEANIQYKTNDDEQCCGSVLLRTGFFDDAKEQMQNNIKYLVGEEILVSCAGCYKTLKQDYSKVLGLNLNVIHTSQLFEKLIKENKLNLNKTNYSVTYHDPCHLGRHMGEYDSARNVISVSAKLIEMEHIRENSNCCGSGGGVKSAFPEISKTIANRRIKEAKDTSADVLVTSCPFCKLNLEDSKSYDDNIDILDLSEFVFNQLNYFED